jgi:hypothetical protein
MVPDVIAATSMSVLPHDALVPKAAILAAHVEQPSAAETSSD